MWKPYKKLFSGGTTPYIHVGIILKAITQYLCLDKDVGVFGEGYVHPLKSSQALISPFNFESIFPVQMSSIFLDVDLVDVSVATNWVVKRL